MCLLGTVNKLTQDAVKSCDVDSPLRAPDTSLVDRTGGGRALDSLQNIIILFISAGIHITHFRQWNPIIGLCLRLYSTFFSKTNKNFIKALHNSFYYSKMYQFTKPTYSYFTLLHYLMILPPYWASQIWWHWPFRSNGKFFFRFKSLKIIYDNVMNRFDLYVTYMNS